MDFQLSDATQVAQHSQLVEELFGERTDNAANSKIVLPFTVRAVRTDSDLRKALRLRATCYGHHFGDTSTSYENPEAEDLDPGSILFLAESKDTGEAVGCLRFMTNSHNQLNIQKHVALPSEITNHHIADIRRLSVVKGRSGRQVKLALFKAVYLHAVAMQVRYLVIGARAPLIRDYLALYFQDIFPEELTVELLGKPHRVLYFDVSKAEREWRERGNRWYETIFHSFHPDIELYRALRPTWLRRRADDPPHSSPPARVPAHSASVNMLMPSSAYIS